MKIDITTVYNYLHALEGAFILYRVPRYDMKGREILKTRPSNLSLGEMFLIARSYTPGSAEFNEVFNIAARVFPDSDVANINAAASALERGDAASASRYLNRVEERDAAWWNNMGVLSWLEGDPERAVRSFKMSGGEAASNSVEMEKYLRSIASR